MSSFKSISTLKEYVLSEKVCAELTDELVKNTGKSDFFTVFLSVCNVKERARVFHGSGTTIAAAWAKAEKNFQNFRQKKPLVPTWAKADIVTSYEEINTVDLNKIVIKEQWTNFSRVGISLDPEFKNAFLEAELNGNKIIAYYTEKEVMAGKYEYDANLIFLDNLNDYLKRNYSTKPIAEIPERITVFNAKGFFCGEDGVVRELYGDAMDYRGRSLDYGRRKIDVVDGDVVKEVIVGASEYLASQIKSDGKFVYGYFPIFDNELTGYNIVRHASSLWSLINLYRMNADENLIPKIDSAINYMQSEIMLKDDDTAYLTERAAGEVKLGANGVAVIMFTEYMDVFNSDKYVDIVRKLANGILELQNAKGGYWHILKYPDFERKEEYRTVYYDGEATFALARAYPFTKEKKFLDGAKLAVEHFIAENYIKHRDHWVAYALFEVTKYIEDTSTEAVRYYEFALQNADKNLKRIYERETSYHTYLEMLMASWRTYKRAVKNKIDSDYIRNYDPTYFAKTIYFRARHMLNGYFYPEYAMYMKAPEKIAGSFMVRHQNYRVRIDDVQHFIGGYYFYSVLYGEIRDCLTDEWILGLDKPAEASENKIESKVRAKMEKPAIETQNEKPLIPIGIFRKYIKIFTGKGSSYVESLFYVGTQFGLQFVIFSPEDIDFETNKVRGKLLNNGELEYRVVDIPPIVDNNTDLDSTISAKLASRTYMLRQRLDTNKQKTYDKLQAEGKFAHLLIPTETINSFEDVEKVLEKNPKAILKHMSSSGGVSVRFVSRSNDGYNVINGQEYYSFNREELHNWYNENIKGKRYVWQPFITSATKNGEPFDVRVSCKLVGDNKFGFKPYVRIGSPKGIISNYRAGGYTLPLDMFLKRNYDNQDIQDEIKRQINCLGRDFPAYYTTIFPGKRFYDIGIDVGITIEENQVKLWIFEVNIYVDGNIYGLEEAVRQCKYMKYLAEKLGYA